MTFFAWEQLSRARVHPLQYLLVGLALSMFYLLLIALSEHLAFLFAYLIAAAALVALISIYIAGALASTRRGVVAASAMTVVYGLLYALVLSEKATLPVQCRRRTDTHSYQPRDTTGRYRDAAPVRTADSVIPPTAAVAGVVIGPLLIDPILIHSIRGETSRNCNYFPAASAVSANLRCHVGYLLPLPSYPLIQCPLALPSSLCERSSPRPTPEDRTMLYIALIAIGIAVASLCYSIEVIDREGLQLLKD